MHQTVGLTVKQTRVTSMIRCPIQPVSPIVRCVIKCNPWQNDPPRTEQQIFVYWITSIASVSLHQSVAAICPKSWGGFLSPSVNPPFFPSLSWTPQAVWAKPAHPWPNILMQFMQSNSLIKSTLMFIALPVPQVQKSSCMPLSAALIYYGLQAMYTVEQHGTNSGGSVHMHLDPTLPESEGVRTPTALSPLHFTVVMLKRTHHWSVVFLVFRRASDWWCKR